MRKIIVLLLMSSLLIGQSLLAEDPDGIRVQYKVGEGTFIGDGKNLFHIQGRFQGRFTYTSVEKGPDTDTFSVPRAEIRMDGFTLEKKLKYGFEVNFATRTANSGVGLLNDYYVDWVPIEEFNLQIGQFKVPFLIQQLTSSTRQQFVDRGLSTGFFDFGRDIGTCIHGSLLDAFFKYSAFLMNGDGSNNLNRNTQALMAGLRLEIIPLGSYDYSESDTSNSENHNLGFGIAYAFNENGAAIQNATIPAFRKANHFTFDIGYKHRGLSLQHAMMLTRTIEGPTTTNWGYNAQAGYFFIPKTFEVALRTGAAIFAPTVNQYEYAVVANYFPMGKGHGIKFQSDYTVLINSTGILNNNDHRFRTAMNLIF